jgi:hypothetical protein
VRTRQQYRSAGGINSRPVCVLRSGRTLGCPNKAPACNNVGSRNAPCDRRAPTPCRYRRMFCITAGRLVHQLLTSRCQHTTDER